IEQVSLPEVSPAINRQKFQGDGSKAVRANCAKHVCPAGIPTVQNAITQVLLYAGPVEFGRRAGKTVKDRAVTGRDFLEKPGYKELTASGNFQVDCGRRIGQG